MTLQSGPYSIPLIQFVCTLALIFGAAAYNNWAGATRGDAHAAQRFRDDQSIITGIGKLDGRMRDLELVERIVHHLPIEPD